jgi:hypothetical protein
MTGIQKRFIPKYEGPATQHDDLKNGTYTNLTKVRVSIFEEKDNLRVFIEGGRMKDPIKTANTV